MGKLVIGDRGADGSTEDTGGTEQDAGVGRMGRVYDGGRVNSEPPTSAGHLLSARGNGTQMANTGGRPDVAMSSANLIHSAPAYRRCAQLIPPFLSVKYPSSVTLLTTMNPRIPVPLICLALLT